MIPFNRPTTAPRTLEYAARALSSNHLAGDGPFTLACQNRLREFNGSAAVLLTTSCTHALEMAALLLPLAPGDEVIMPSFNFPSAANAFVLRGVRPIFVDVDPNTLNLDESLLEAVIGPRTKAIVVLHYGGVVCEMDSITEIAARHGIPVVEDIAHSLFATYKARPAGSFGTFAAASFHETKNITCGEGGALFINDPALATRAEVVREKGTNRTQSRGGEVSKYSWVDVGSSYLPSDVLAALLLAQLDDVEQSQGRRAAAWHSYEDELADWAAATGTHLPTVPGDRTSSHHVFPLLLPAAEARDGLLTHLRERDILAVFHYLPLHLSEMGRRFGGRRGQLPITESVSERLLRLPLFADITPREQETIVNAVREFRG